MLPELFNIQNQRYGRGMTDQKVKKAKLVAPPRPGVYSRGSDTVDAILKAALHVLVEEGASAFTLRRIAAQCGMKVGNVSRHFPRKEMLVQVLLEELLLAHGRDQNEHAGQSPQIEWASPLLWQIRRRPSRHCI